MQYYIYHWRGGPLPEGTIRSYIANINGDLMILDTIYIENIHEFAIIHKDIRLLSPFGDIPLWRIYITDKGWSQR